MVRVGIVQFLKTKEVIRIKILDLRLSENCNYEMDA